MLDALTRLLEKLIELFKMRSEAEARMFELVVAPLYADLKVIHEDYMRMFEECRQSLQAGACIREVAARLLKDRLEQEALRGSVRSFVRVYEGNSHLSHYREFFRAVGWYLADCSFDNSVSYRLLVVLEACAQKEKVAEYTIKADPDVRDDRSYVIGETERILNHLRRSWQRVSHEYATLVTKRLPAA